MGTATSAVASASTSAPRRSLSLGRLSDELLARQAERGSERAFATLYERYYQQLYRYCRSIVRNDADAQDVLQSTFAGALSALHRGQRKAPVRPWLYRIAHNEAISLLRRQSRESDQEVTEASAPVASSVEDEAAGRARWSALVSDLARLPERQRSALVLRELSGLSHEEIAVALGTSVGGAKQAIFEARQGLMELTEGRDMSCDEVRRRLSAGDRRVLRGRKVRAHLRDCRGCEAFATEISARRSELRALAPVLPSAAAAAVLSRAMHAASAAHGGSAAAASSAVTAGAAGKAAGTALAWKAVTGVALVATAAAGVTGLAHVLRHGHAEPRPAARAGHHRPSPAPRDAVASGGSTRADVRAATESLARAHSSHAASAAVPAAAAHPGSTSASTTPGTNGRGNSTASHGSTVAVARTHGAGRGHAVARGPSSPIRGGSSTSAHGKSAAEHGRPLPPVTVTTPRGTTGAQGTEAHSVASS